METRMGRPPIGKVAMTASERLRRQRLKRAAMKLAAADSAAAEVAALKYVLTQIKLELERKRERQRRVIEWLRTSNYELDRKYLWLAQELRQLEWDAGAKGWSAVLDEIKRRADRRKVPDEIKRRADRRKTAG
jgi:hypothetical protein